MQKFDSKDIQNPDIFMDEKSYSDQVPQLKFNRVREQAFFEDSMPAQDT